MKAVKLVALALPCLLTFASLAAAQGPPPAEFIQVLTVTLRPGGVAEYEDYVKKILGGATKAGAPQFVYGYQPMLGGPGYTYIFVLPFSKWADVDGFMPVPQILSKAYGDVETARIMRSGRGAVERSGNEVFRYLKDLSTRPRIPDPQPPLWLVVRTEVEPEMASAYDLYLAKLKAAQEQMPDARTSNRYVSAQGLTQTYVTTVPLSKLAEMDAAPSPMDALRKAYGEAEARHLNESSLRAVRRREISVVNYRPDLSRPGPSPAR